MQRLIFEYSPIYFIACLAAGLGYAWLLYSSKHSWSIRWNRFLFVVRAALVTALLLLLLGPILKQTENIFEEPTVVLLVDNSGSVRETQDTARLMAAVRQARETLGKEKLRIEWSDLHGKPGPFAFDAAISDLSSALRETVNRYEGKNLAGIVLISDGIYNSGISPLYQPVRVPVYTIGIGDTTERVDLILKNVAYNRIVYQGNKFPLRAEVGVQGLPGEDITVSVLSQGKVLQQVRKNTATKSLVAFDFQLDAATQGVQRLEVRVEANPRESNSKNNLANAFIEVVEGKKKILIVAPAPHPDIKALRGVIEKNPNYECLVHVPGIKEIDPEWLQPGKVDLLVAHQSPDGEGRTNAILNSFLQAKSSVLLIIGQRTQLPLLQTLGVALNFEGNAQRDEVQAVLNPGFSDLGFSDGLNSNVTRYPPITVPFGKFSYPATAKTILYQRIGSVVTERPLLFAIESDQQKLGVLVGEGTWRWRLNEFQETEKTGSFDELFSKLIQYLSTREDKRKFRSFPLQQEFTGDGPVVMESQVFNDLFQPVFGNTIDLEIRDEQNNLSSYRYVTGPGNNRYRIGGLKEGVYRYKASTELKGKREEVRGEFLVTGQNQESLNLTADFDLLRSLSRNTGGHFYKLADVDKLSQQLTQEKLSSVIHSEESFQPLINLKAVFFLLLLLISMEWFLRKYLGGY